MRDAKTIRPFAGIFILIIFFGACLLYYSQRAQAQDVTQLTKKVIEAKGIRDAEPYLGKLAQAYFADNRYNGFVDYLNSLLRQKNGLMPVLAYYIGFARYQQIKYLEEAQEWDEYFSKGNDYRKELVDSLNSAIGALDKNDPLFVYAKLLLWKYHADMNDAEHAQAKEDFISSALDYAKKTDELEPVLKAAEELNSYNESAGANSLYKVYAEKVISSSISNKELAGLVEKNFDGKKLELAETLCQAYMDRPYKAQEKNERAAFLINMAKRFSYDEKEPTNPVFAEKIFEKIASLGAKEFLNEELMYLRAYNLEKIKAYPDAKDYFLELLDNFPKSTYSDEANYKIGIIHTYVLRDAKGGRKYFELLAEREVTSPQVISGIYQLGLLKQWELDLEGAKAYYEKLIKRAGENYQETVSLAKERLNEIEKSQPIEYKLRTFLDVSFKNEYASMDIHKLNLKSFPYRSNAEKEVDTASLHYAPESGCINVEVEYLWSGHTGKVKPTVEQYAYQTEYLHPGTKEVNLVVVSPNGVLGRSIDMVDIE